PIYDTVFKKMMENERVAKFFIGTLLDQEIENIEVKPQEFTYTNELLGLAVFRLDFIATLKLETGELKKVLIEIQKAKNYIDLMRFRRYLGEQYKKEDVINAQKTILPITTIYILGFKLPELETACIKVERNYKDLVNKKIIDKKSDFIEKLSHDCYIVQVERITNRFQSSLDKLLSVFEQNHFTDDQKITKIFSHPTDNEDLKLLTGILHHSGTSPEERKILENEEEAWRTVNAAFEDKEKELVLKIKESEKIINDKDKALEEKDKALKEKEKTLEEKNKALEEKDKALEEIKHQLDEIKRKIGL
ncbi:MAG: hypothetical protein KA327_01065, partial [Pseudarcicella sp.]|nr:hypothetical protein [Pseudarcicella sp.]